MVGDKSDHGGEVLEGSPKALINGKMIARLGDKVHCRRCRGTQTIAEGDPRVIVDGKPAAFHGAKTSCGAVLIASMVDNTIGGPPEPLPPESDWSFTPEANEFPREAMAVFPKLYMQPATANGLSDAVRNSGSANSNAACANEDATKPEMSSQGPMPRGVNKTWAGQGKVWVSRDEDGVTTLHARLTVSGYDANFAARSVNRYWQGKQVVDSNGRILKSDVVMVPVAENGDWQVMKMTQPTADTLRTQYNQKFCTNYSDREIRRIIGALNVRGQSTVEVNNGWHDNEANPAHEFAHALGLSHSAPGTRAISSYDLNDPAIGPNGIGVTAEELSLLTGAYPAPSDKLN